MYNELMKDNNFCLKTGSLKNKKAQ